MVLVDEIESEKTYHVEHLDPSDLMANPANWRTHPADQRAAVEQSLDENGYLQTVLVNRRLAEDGGGLVIVDGHLRVEIANDRGEKSLPCRVISVPKWQEHRILLTLDRTAEMAGHDDEALLKLLEESAESALGLPMAYSEDILNDLRSRVFGELEELDGGGEEVRGDSGDDDIERDAVPSRCSRGDVWELGRHMLYVGRWEDAAKTWPFNCADIIHADPPYGIALKPTWSQSEKYRGEEYKPVAGDDQAFDPGPLLNLGVSQVILWGANHYANLLPPSPFWFVWDKQGNAGEDGLDLHRDHADIELAWISVAKPSRLHTHVWDGFRRDSEKGERRIHPNQKPVSIIETALGYLDGETVFEPFGGSGSTLMACERTGRTCYIAELDEQYASYTIARWEAATGLEAVKL